MALMSLMVEKVFSRSLASSLKFTEVNSLGMKNTNIFQVRLYNMMRRRWEIDLRNGHCRTTWPNKIK